MDELNLINIDLFKNSYYKALLPLPAINTFLEEFNPKELDAATRTLISLFDVNVTKAIIINLNSDSEIKEFMRMLHDDPANPEIINYLIDKFPGSEELIKQTLERTLLSAKKAIL